MGAVRNRSSACVAVFPRNRCRISLRCILSRIWVRVQLFRRRVRHLEPLVVELQTSLVRRVPLPGAGVSMGAGNTTISMHTYQHLQLRGTLLGPHGPDGTQVLRGQHMRLHQEAVRALVGLPRSCLVADLLRDVLRLLIDHVDCQSAQKMVRAAVRRS